MTRERETAILHEPVSQTDDWSIAICEGATIDDLDPEAIALARVNYKNKFPDQALQVHDWNDETFLNKAKITIKGKITRAAILLLGRSEAEHFVSPAEAKIRWVLRDKDNVEIDYEIFTCPFLLNVDKVFNKIRNLKYRYMRDHTSLFPEEVDKYEPYIIREALNNCIAHQDYTLSGRINVVEKDDELIFTNKGTFIPGTVENVIRDDAPEELYRNRFLANAMLNLKMVDTIGSGIRRMFNFQRSRLFPLPEYDLSDRRVKVTITAKVLDINYAHVLSRNPELSLAEIMLLDKVQKKKELTEDEARHLRDKGLIEGRRPALHISAELADLTGQRAEYIRAKGVDDAYCKRMIEDYIKQFKSASRSDLEKVLMEKLPDALTKGQKKHKIKNLLQALKKEGRIELTSDRTWILSKVKT